MQLQDIFNDLNETYKTIDYQGNEIEIILYLDESRNTHENIPLLAKQLENLESLDKIARDYLVKSIRQDNYFIEHMFSSILEDGAMPDTKLGEFFDKYGDGDGVASEMTAEEFVSTLRIGGIIIHVDSPESERSDYDSNELNSAENPNLQDNDIYIELKYIFDGEGNEGLFWEWELRSRFNLQGEYVASYFGKQF